MMRSLFVILAICSVFGLPANSQETTSAVNNDDKIPVYFLVDASGSMQGKNKADAELLLSALSLPRDQLVSVNYFGAKPENPQADLCFEDIEVVPPSLRGEEFAPKLPELGGKEDRTAITNAVRSVLGKIVGPAKIIVITDGGEECDNNFLRVRDAFPSADIQVLQVGNRQNTDLQKIEIVPSPTISAPLISPVVSLSFRFGSADQSANAWATGWYERRLWLVALFSVLVCACFWGSSFGIRANYYEAKTKSIEQKRSEILRKEDVSDEQIDAAMPDKVNESDVKAVGTPAAWRSGFFFTIAFLLGAPLVLVDFVYPHMLRWVLTVFLAVALGAFLIFVIRKAKPVAYSNADDEFPRPKQRVIVSGILGSIPIIFVVWACWIDLLEAQRASWFVLSADLSAALAISASAPLLFVGSKWWQFEMAKSNYMHTYTEALSSTQREKRRNAKRIDDSWTKLKSLHLAWRPETEFKILGTVSTFWDGRVRRARGVVVEKLRLIAIQVAGATATEPRR